LGFSIRKDAKVISVADLALKHAAGAAGKGGNGSSSSSSSGSDSESDDANPFQDRLKSMFTFVKHGQAKAAAAKASGAAASSSGRRLSASSRGADGPRASRQVETPRNKGASEAGPGSGSKSAGRGSSRKRLQGSRENSDGSDSEGDDAEPAEPKRKKGPGRPPRKVTDLSGAQTDKATSLQAEFSKIKGEADGLTAIPDDCDMSMDGVKEAKKAQGAKVKQLEAALIKAKALEKKVIKFDADKQLLDSMPADLTDLIDSMEQTAYVIKNVFNDRADVDRFISTLEAVLETSKTAGTAVGFVYFSKYLSIKCASAMRFADMTPFVDLCTRDSIGKLGFNIDTDEKSDRARRVVSANIESACCSLMSKVTARDIRKTGPSITFLGEFLDKLKGAKNLHASDGAPEQIKQLSVIINSATSPVEDLMHLLSLIGCLPEDVEGADNVDLPEAAETSGLPPLLRILSDHPMGEALLNAAGAEVKQRSEELKLRKSLEGCAPQMKQLVENYSDISDAGFLDAVKKAPGVQNACSRGL